MWTFSNSSVTFSNPLYTFSGQGPGTGAPTGPPSTIGPGISPNWESVFTAQWGGYTPVATAIRAALNVTESSDSIAAAASLSIVGVSAALEGRDTIVALAVSGNSGSVNAFEGGDYAVSAGVLTTTAYLAITEGSDGIATVAYPRVTGSGSILEGQDQPVGLVGTPTYGTMFEGLDAIAASGLLTTMPSANVLEGADSISTAGLVTTSATLSVTESQDAISTAAALVDIASGAVIEGLDSIAGVGSASFSGSLALTEGADSIATSAVTQVTGAANMLEAMDSIATAASTMVTGSGSVLESADIIQGAAAAQFAGNGQLLEGNDVCVGMASSIPTLFGYCVITPLSQTGFQSANMAYIENSACIVDISYFSAQGNPFIPVAVGYRIDDVTTDFNILPWTVITPVGYSNQVTITAQQNFLISLSRNDESHQVLFAVTDSYGDTNYANVRFNVIRVTGEMQPGFTVASGCVTEESDSIVAFATVG